MQLLCLHPGNAYLKMAGVPSDLISSGWEEWRNVLGALVLDYFKKKGGQTKPSCPYENGLMPVGQYSTMNLKERVSYFNITV